LMIASIFFIDFSSLSAKAPSSAGSEHNPCQQRSATAATPNPHVGSQFAFSCGRNVPNF
jgi:hypothetical protein